MRRWAIALSVVALSIFALYPLVLTGKSDSESYKQDAKGLAKQFEPFLKAYAKGGTAGPEETFKVFQFADAKAWFGEYFRVEEVQQLAWDAEAEVEGERNSLRMMMNLVGRGSRFHAHCKAHSEEETGTGKERQSSVHSLKPVPVEQFEIEFQAEESGKRFSFLGNFVYVAGAYKYVGKGAFPFWAMPDANDPAKK